MALVRSTPEQIKFREAMKLLIDLYYRFLASEGKDWYSDETILLAANIFDLTIPNFSPCLYIQEYSMFRFRGSDEKLKITENQIKDFLSIMAAIHSDLSRGINRFFELKDRVIRTQVKTGISTCSTAEQIEATEQGKIKNIQLCKIIPPVSKAADAKTQDEYLHTINMRLNDPPDEYESFCLTVNRDSALDAEFFLDDALTISCPGYTHQDVFFRSAVKYLLVKYQFLFGSFERIKICKQCKKLFVENKLGARKYCSGTCRKRHHDSLQSEEKRLCRERQNAWIRYRRLFHDWQTVFTLQKEDCSTCPGTVESGRCPVLMTGTMEPFDDRPNGATLGSG